MPQIPSDLELYLLGMIIDNPGSYGLKLVKDPKVKRGSVYTTLKRMESKGLISSRTQATPLGHQGPRRRVYSATEYGKKVFEITEPLRLLQEERDRQASKTKSELNSL